MTNLPPVWLLDIDGVINAVSRKPDRGVWPKDRWIQGTAHGSGTDWPIHAAGPVVDFIRETHGSGRAEVRWHTTWQHEAANVAKLLGLPDFEVQACPEYAVAHQAVAGAEPLPVRGVWWKLPAAERVVGEEGRALVWTDDDANRELRGRSGKENLSRLAPTLIVCPRTHIGLTRKHLRMIDGFLTEMGAR